MYDLQIANSINTSFSSDFNIKNRLRVNIIFNIIISCHQVPLARNLAFVESGMKTSLTLRESD